MSKLISSSNYEEKKSKFMTYLFELHFEDEIKEIFESLKKEHKKANHICYGGKFEDVSILKNDGEVGQPSRVILQILETNNLQSHLLVCIRYFGGIKLGVGGVSRAFRKASSLCVENYKKSNSK